MGVTAVPRSHFGTAAPGQTLCARVLSPLPGLYTFLPFTPQLALWAALLRRFAAEQAAEKLMLRPAAPEGAMINVPLLAQLKLCPHTNRTCQTTGIIH